METLKVKPKSSLKMASNGKKHPRAKASPNGDSINNTQKATTSSTRHSLTVSASTSASTSAHVDDPAVIVNSASSSTLVLAHVPVPAKALANGKQANKANTGKANTGKANNATNEPRAARNLIQTFAEIESSNGRPKQIGLKAQLATDENISMEQLHNALLDGGDALLPPGKTSKSVAAVASAKKLLETSLDDVSPSTYKGPSFAYKPGKRNGANRPLLFPESLRRRASVERKRQQVRNDMDMALRARLAKSREPPIFDFPPFDWVHSKMLPFQRPPGGSIGMYRHFDSVPSTPSSTGCFSNGSWIPFKGKKAKCESKAQEQFYEYGHSSRRLSDSMADIKSLDEDSTAEPMKPEENQAPKGSRIRRFFGGIIRLFTRVKRTEQQTESEADREAFRRFYQAHSWPQVNSNSLIRNFWQSVRDMNFRHGKVQSNVRKRFFENLLGSTRVLIPRSATVSREPLFWHFATKETDLSEKPRKDTGLLGQQPLEETADVHKVQ